MKNPKYLIMLIPLLCLFSGALFSQSNGDYRSHASGSAPFYWATAGNWETYNTDSVKWLAAVNPPGQTNNVTIRAGDTISIGVAGGVASCFNLTIEANGALQSDNLSVRSSGVTFRVFGTTATINGTLGVPVVGDGINLDYAGSRTTLTFTGSGTMDIARVRMYTGGNTVVFDMNAKLYYAGGGGGGGYGLQANRDSSTFTITSSHTLAFATNSGVSVGTDTSAVSYTVTLNVSGTLADSGALVFRVKTGHADTLRIYNGGSVTVVGDFLATRTVDGGSPTVTSISGTGTLTCNGTADFSNPGMTVTGTGSFILSPAATLNIGHLQGITSSGATGQIQTTTRTFDTKANYVYVDTSAQATGSGLPSSVRSLTINNSKGVTLSAATTVDTTLTLTNGKLTLGSNSLTIRSSGTISGGSDASYVVTDGTGVLTRNSVGAGDTLFAVGTASSYNPAMVNNAGTADNFSVLVKSSFDHNPPDLNKVVNRQWTVTEGVAGGSNVTLKLQWNNADQASGFDPNGSVAVSRYVTSAWVDSPAIVNGTGPYIAAAAGFTSFSNFIVQNGAFPSFHSRPTSVNFGGVNVSSPKSDSVFVKNAGSQTLSVTSVVSSNPVFAVTPSNKTINGGDSAKFTITFTPSAGGLTSGSIVFTHNAVTSPDTVRVSGVGLLSGARFSVDRKNIGFDTVLVGASRRDSVTVMDIGNTSLVIDSIRVRVSADFSVNPTGPVTLSPAATGKFYMAFTPTAGGAQTALVLFYSNAGTSPDSVYLSGYGVGPIYSTGTHPGGASWNTPSTWQGGVVPRITDNVVIRGPDSVYVTTIDTCYGVTVQSGATLADSAKLVVTDMTVNGTVIVYADTLNPTDTMIVGNGGVYVHALDAGRVPTGKWGTGSLCLMTGLATTQPANVNQNFYNYTWNCPGQVSNMNTAWNGNTVSGNVTILQTGGAQYRLTSNTVAGTADSITLNILGNVILNGINPSVTTDFRFSSTSSGSKIYTVNVGGNIFVSGNSHFAWYGSSGGSNQPTWKLKGNFTATGGILENPLPSAKIAFVGSGVTQTLNIDTTAGAVTQTGRLNWQFGDTTANTVVNIGTSQLGGSACTSVLKNKAKVIVGPTGFIGGGTNTGSVASTFTIENGGTLVIGPANGIRATGHGSSGAVQVSGTRSYAKGANYEYVGVTGQKTGSGLPDTVNRMTINNAAGVTLDSTAGVTVNDTMFVVNGSLTMPGGAILTLGPTGALNETPGHTVVGKVRTTRKVGASSAVTFGGIGAVLTSSAVAPDTTSVVRLTGTAQTGSGRSSILRYFDIAPKVNAGLNATLDLSYDSTELSGQDVTSMMLWKSTDVGSTWTYQPSSNNIAQRKLTATGVNSFSRWTLADAADELAMLNRQLMAAQSWNMISLPYVVADSRKVTVFPLANSNAFTYFHGYVIKDTLQNGVGYWLKFPAKETVFVTGFDIMLDTFDVRSGWNMIGSICRPVPKSTITQIPDGIVNSQYFSYSSGYAMADTIKPGQAYWVKTNGGGKLVLKGTWTMAKKGALSSDLVSQFSSLTITDRDGNKATLYLGLENKRLLPSMCEMPPLPQASAFDVRYASQRFIETYVAASEKEQTYPITLQSAVYPITVQWKVLDAARSFTLTNASQGQTNLRQTLTGTGSLTLDKPVIGLLLIASDPSALPKEFSLGANYPNPFNPSTRFVVAIPQTAHVEIVVYDLLGRKVKTLLNEERSPGYSTIEWNGCTDNNTMAPSGVYFVRMMSEKFTAVHKIMMMK
jgi:hypothetical protein